MKTSKSRESQTKMVMGRDGLKDTQLTCHNTFRSACHDSRFLNRCRKYLAQLELEMLNDELSAEELFDMIWEGRPAYKDLPANQVFSEFYDAYLDDNTSPETQEEMTFKEFLEYTLADLS